jgi:prophage regulatory protein
MSSAQVQRKPRFTSIPEATAMTGLSRTTQWRMARQGKFPRAIAISPGRVAYITEELDRWIADRIEEREPGRRPNHIEAATA